MKGIVKPLIIVTATGAIMYAAGCAVPVKSFDCEDSVAESFERMDNPVAKKVKPAEVSNPVAAAERVLVDTISFYKDDVKSDKIINCGEDATELSDLMDTVAALRVNPIVKGMQANAYTKKCLSQADNILSMMVAAYEMGTNEDALFVVNVDAIGKEIGKQNYGWRNPKGGYVVEGSFEDAKYAIWASMCTENAGTGRAYPLEEKIAKLKLGSKSRGSGQAYTVAKKYVADHKDKEAQADAIVAQLKAKAVVTDPRPLTSAEERGRYGTHVSGRQVVAMVYSMSENANKDWQTQGIQKLFNNSKADDRWMVGQEEGTGVVTIVPGASLDKRGIYLLDIAFTASEKLINNKK